MSEAVAKKKNTAYYINSIISLIIIFGFGQFLIVESRALDAVEDEVATRICRLSWCFLVRGKPFSIPCVAFVVPWADVLAGINYAFKNPIIVSVCAYETGIVVGCCGGFYNEIPSCTRSGFYQVGRFCHVTESITVFSRAFFNYLDHIVVHCRVGGRSVIPHVVFQRHHQVMVLIFDNEIIVV